MSEIEQLNFLSPAEVAAVAEQWGTPTFVYDEATLRHRAGEALDLDAPFGLTVRYAMKANPNAAILQIFDSMGVAIDASSGFEAERALRAGIDPDNILVTSQEFPNNIVELTRLGVEFNACSLDQLERYGKLLPGTSVGVRINPGLGSGHSNRTNVGGPASSFGIWHESTDQVKAIAEKHQLTIDRLHTHIGSGSDPAVWAKAAQMSLKQVEKFPDVTTLNLGGGFKIARMQNEHATDMHAVGKVVNDALLEFQHRTGRRLHLEVEPGTFLVANAGSLVTTVKDIVSTGPTGYQFIKVDSGMNDIMRPSLYGAQHPLVVVNERPPAEEHYVVVGHCCESGDLLTPAPGDPESLTARPMQRAEIGDRLVIEGVGAYCEAMSARGYNSFPSANAVLRRVGGAVVQIGRRTTLEEMLSNEVPL